MNKKIWSTFDKGFDIGCKVVKWDDPEGFNFIPNKKYIKRDISHEELQRIIKQFTVHWSVTYRAKHMYSGLKARGLSVNFMIDDDCNEDGCATIYQCLPICYGAYSQGGIYNSLGSGVEISYMPQAYDDNMYDLNDQKKWKVPPHETAYAPVHGTKLKVHLPTKAQEKALYNLIWGYCELFPEVTPEFPRTESGEYSTTVLKHPEDYKGLVSHYHLTRRKIDVAGLDMKTVEDEVRARLKWGY